MVSLLLMQGADPDWKDRFGISPLMYAVINGSDACVQYLLEHGAKSDDVIKFKPALLAHLCRHRPNRIFFLQRSLEDRHNKVPDILFNARQMAHYLGLQFIYDEIINSLERKNMIDKPGTINAGLSS